MKNIIIVLVLLAANVASRAGILVTPVPQDWMTFAGLDPDQVVAAGAVDLRVGGALYTSSSVFGQWENTYPSLFPAFKPGVVGRASFGLGSAPNGINGLLVGWSGISYLMQGLPNQQDGVNAAILSIHGGVRLGLGDGRTLLEGNYLVRMTDGVSLSKFEAVAVGLNSDPAAGIGWSMFQTPAVWTVPEPMIAPVGIAVVAAFMRRRRHM